MTRLTVRRGSTGSIVAELQRKLGMFGYYHGPPHGKFDAETEKAVIAFQRAERLNADGIVGIKTWAALNGKRNKPQPPAHFAPPPPNHGSKKAPIRDLPKPPPRITPMPKPASKPGHAGAHDPKPLNNNKIGIAAGPPSREKPVVATADSPEAMPVMSEPTPPDNLLRDDVVAVINPHVNEAADVVDTAVQDSAVEVINPHINAAEDAVDAAVQNNAVEVINPHISEAEDAVDTAAQDNVVDAIKDSFQKISLEPERRTVLHPGDTGGPVQALQMTLHILGYYNCRINGIFDSATEQAVVLFQQAKGEKADGVVTPDIWLALDDAITAHTPKQPAPALPAPESRVTLRLGESGETIQVLQMMLQLLDYYDGPVNSVFDETTMKSVTAFQNGNGLVPDGIVGQKTWKQLDNAILNLCPVQPSGHFAQTRPSLQPGDTGEAVKVLQMMLYILDCYSGTVNSVYDEATKQAVIDFQKNSGLTPANVVGSATWQALNNALDEHVPALHIAPLSPPAPKISKTRDKISMCWVQNPRDFAVATDAFNVVSPVWYDLTASGESLDINPRNASAEFTQAAHKRGINVWGTLQSFDASLTRRLVTNEAEILQFIDKIKELSTAHQLDGLCIDFEYMHPEDKDAYTEFVRRMSGALKSGDAFGEQFVICVCFTAPSPQPDDEDNMWSACVDRAALGLICDYCCLMLYDELGPGSGAGPIASQSWAVDGFKKTLEYVPPQSLLLGVPFYSAKWSSRTGNTAMYLTMDMVQSLLDNGYFTDRSGSTIKVARYIEQPSYQDGELYTEFLDTMGNTHKIYAHMPQTVSARLALVSENDLAGAAFWEYFYSNKAALEVVREQLSHHS